MSKKNGSNRHQNEAAKTAPKHEPVAADRPPRKMKRKAYELELERLQGELVAMQEWVKSSGAKIVIVFEGRDTAGKGGTIKRIVERVSPRVFRVVALPAPTEREQTQMYVQRYAPHFPAAGEVVIFDRSWYNRAGVERVMGFCTPEQTDRFLEQIPTFEKAMVDSGILLIKYWLEVSAEEQTTAAREPHERPAQDLEAVGHGPEVYSRWYDYRGRATRCSRRPTRRGRRGTSRTPRIKNGAAQHHLAPVERGAVRATGAQGRGAAETPAATRYERPDLPLRHIPTPY